MLNASQKRTKRAPLRLAYACIAVRLVGHDAHALAVETGKAYDDVAGIVFLHFKELAVVHDGPDDLIHVVCLVRIVRDDFVQRVFHAVDGVGAFHARSFLHVVLRDVAQQRADGGQALFFRLGREMRHAGLGGMYACAAQVFLRHVFARHRLHHFRTGEEHIRSALHHQREVRQGGRIDRTAGAGAEDARNLGYHAGGHDVTLEYLGESAQSIDAFLDTCAAGVVQTDAGCAHFHGLVHDLADFFSHRFRQRTAVHGEVLCEDINQTAVYRAATGHHAVAQVLFLLHAEVRATVQFEHIHFLEAARIEQHVDAFASRVLAFGMLFLNGFFSASHTGFGAQFY